MSNKIGNKILNRENPNDVIYTPKPVALKMIDFCNIKKDMSVLDPSKGGGVFYDNLPECKKDYCEITEGKDFFKCETKYDLIIGNPPYSLWNKWLDHTMKLTNKFCYIFGFLNFTDTRLKYIIDKGYGITKMHLLKVDWWFGHSLIILFEKNKPSLVSVEEKRVICDICDSRCKRGRAGIGMNTCTNHKIEDV
jgi:hypothetical protein